MRTPTPDEIAARVRELAAGVPCPQCGPTARIKLSFRRIAEIVGISHTTVMNLVRPRKRPPSRPPQIKPRRTRVHRCPKCGSRIEFDACVKCESLAFIEQRQPMRFLRVYA